MTPDTSGEHDIAITLTKEQAASVSKVYKVVFSDVSNVNGYGCTFLSSDVNIEGNKFTADFDVLSYQLNSNGKSIPIYLTEVQSVGDERIFEAYVEVCRTKSFDIHRAAYFRLRILFSNEYPDGKIIGLIPLHAEQSCAPIEIKDGYSIWTLDTYYKGVTRDENGRIQPMYQWEERGMLMSREVLEVKGGCTLTKDTKGEEGVSQYYHVCLLFQDTYGDAFMTEIVDLKPGRTREAAD